MTKVPYNNHVPSLLLLLFQTLIFCMQIFQYKCNPILRHSQLLIIEMIISISKQQNKVFSVVLFLVFTFWIFNNYY
jgi:hypothetical protein